jgi:septal ring factor EnvC (AmiA/AmiB activator)
MTMSEYAGKQAEMVPESQVARKELATTADRISRQIEEMNARIEQLDNERRSLMDLLSAQVGAFAPPRPAPTTNAAQAYPIGIGLSGYGPRLT